MWSALALAASLWLPGQEQAPDGGGGGNVPNPSPDPSGVPGQDAVETLLDVISWLGVAACVAAIVVGGGIMAVSHASANGMYGSRGRTVLLAGLGGGLVVALAGQLVQFMVGLA
jgi:hypothetical protein